MVANSTAQSSRMILKGGAAKSLPTAAVPEIRSPSSSSQVAPLPPKVHEAEAGGVNHISDDFSDHLIVLLNSTYVRNV